jgi:hypothetical protein
VGRAPERREKALELLKHGARTVQRLASEIGISRFHARTLMNQLRELEMVRVVGEDRGTGEPAKVWGLVSPFRRCDQWAPVIQKEAADAERERWLADLLDKWQRFMRAYWGPQGYPQHSPGMPARARIQSFDDMEEEVDRFMVAACDACIDSLPDQLRTAIYYRNGLTDCWNYSGHPQEVVDIALELLIVRLKERIAVP